MPTSSWIEKADRHSATKHTGTSSAALQHQVGEWLGLFTVIKLPKNQPSLSEEELTLISSVMRHNVVIGGMLCIGEEVGVGFAGVC